MKKISLAILVLLVASIMWGANLISENIQTWTARASYGSWTQSITAGTVNMTACMVQPSASASGTGTLGRIQLQATTGIVALPALASAGTAEFHIASGGAARTVKLQRYVGSTWTDLTTFTGIGTTGITLTYNVNSSSSTTLRLASPSSAIYVHDIIVTDYSAGTPTITVSGTLNAFSTVSGNVSASQSYKVSGANLTADIIVTAPANFELSKTVGGTYTSGLIFNQTGGVVAEQDVFVRIAASATAGTYTNVNITHTSSTASANKAVSGTIYKTEPTNHATTFIVDTGTPSYSVIDVVWDDATGTVVPDGYLVKGSSTSYAAITAPSDGTAETNSALVKNAAAGVETVSFTGLTENTTYYFKIFPYTNSGANINYKVNEPVPSDDAITSYGAPAIPTANNATAVSHEGFTARWDAVSGASSYRLDVLQGSPTVATDLFISEYLEGSSNNKAIEVYNGTGSTVDLSVYSIRKQTNGAGAFGGDTALTGTLAHGDVFILAHSSSNATILAQSDLTKATTPVDFNGNDVVALFKNSVEIDRVGILDQVSPSWGADVTLVRKSTVTSPTTSYSISYWDSYLSDTFTYLGSHTMGSAPTPVFGYNDLTVSDTIKRVSGLTASTDYTYRVRAYNSNGTSSNSNIIVVSTTASTSGAGANTAIGGASTVVAIPALPNFTDNSIEIDPDTSTNDDFTITVAQIATGITYTISTSNNLALNGTYLLNHAGFVSAPNLTASIGSMVVNASDADASIVTISGISAKGDLVITAEGEETLPVELSSFTATLNAQNNVSLMWVTQSETGVNGFYVHRGSDNLLANAEVVSPLISATNTSQQQVYLFSDSEISESGTYYYWLQVQDLDGGIAYHGPTSFVYENNGNSGTPNIPLTTELKGIYPNPFNPDATISYGLAKQGEVNISVYNPRGQLVRSFREGIKAAGNYNLRWNGTDDSGRTCGTGVYYIKMQAGKDSYMRKAVLLK